MSKGSNRRPQEVSDAVMEENWRRTFTPEKIELPPEYDGVTDPTARELLKRALKRPHTQNGSGLVT